MAVALSIVRSRRSRSAFEFPSSTLARFKLLPGGLHINQGLAEHLWRPLSKELLAELVKERLNPAASARPDHHRGHGGVRQRVSAGGIPRSP